MHGDSLNCHYGFSSKFFLPSNRCSTSRWCSKSLFFSHQCRSPSNALCLSCFQTKTERIPFGVINFFVDFRVLRLAGTVCKSVSLHYELPSTRTCSTHFNNRDYDINIWEALLAWHFLQVVHSEYNGWPYCKKQAIVHLHPSNCLKDTNQNEFCAVI